jgi:hypothetical protein
MKKILILLFSLMALTACDDIFVKDISDKQINIVAPANNIVLDKNEVTLVWEELEGAQNYHVIIVSPSLAEVRYYACDSITDDYKLKVSLPDGTYEWSVQATNSAHESLKTHETFQIAIP